MMSPRSSAVLVQAAGTWTGSRTRLPRTRLPYLKGRPRRNGAIHDGRRCASREVFPATGPDACPPFDRTPISAAWRCSGPPNLPGSGAYAYLCAHGRLSRWCGSGPGSGCRLVRPPVRRGDSVRLCQPSRTSAAGPGRCWHAALGHRTRRGAAALARLAQMRTLRPVVGRRWCVRRRTRSSHAGTRLAIRHPAGS
jgi:hypothetical protein